MSTESIEAKCAAQSPELNNSLALAAGNALAALDRTEFIEVHGEQGYEDACYLYNTYM